MVDGEWNERWEMVVWPVECEIGGVELRRELHVEYSDTEIKY